MKSALNRSLHGRPITVKTMNPQVTMVHTMSAVSINPAIVSEVFLELSNPGSGDLVAEIHYNNGALYESVPARSTRKVNMIIEGDSPACFVANPHLAVTLDANSPSGSELSVTGGVESFRSRTPLNRSVGGRAITVATKIPTPTYLHTMQDVDLRHPNKHDVHLELSNTECALPIIVELHYNNSVIFATVPPYDTKPVDFTINGDSPEALVGSPHLVAYLHSSAPSGAEVKVMGSVEIQ